MLQLQVIAFTIILGLSAQVALGQPDVTRPCSASATQIHEGDMTFVVSQNGVLHGNKTKRGLTRWQFHRWSNAIVPYTIGSGFSEADRSLILKGMRHWEDNTCLRFRLRTTERDYINYYPGSGGCCSYIGRLGLGQQGVSLGRNCIAFQTVVHEIGHVIGFHHEQSRPDRDRYIRVLYNNIKPDARRQYDISTNINSRGVGYDYNSIMHYNDNFFAIRSGVKTMESIPSGIVLGHALRLSPLDILQARNFYECDRLTPGPPLVPEVIDPTPPPPTLPFPSCGQIVTATNGVITPPGYPTFRHNQRCGWIIALDNPRGYRLRINIQVSVEQSSGCTKDYIEVLNGKFTTSRRIGSRLCSRGNYAFTTSRGEALIQYKTDGFNSGGTYNGFSVTYSSEDLDECALGFNRFCSHGCQNLIGSFTCTCRPGFRLSADKETCFDIQECAINNGGCEHTCTNTAGSFSCSCNSGYVLQPDGKRCLRPSTSTCENNNGGCQQLCRNAPGRVICSCRTGYTLNSDQRSCSDVNECSTNNGGCGQTCRNTEGSRVCSCRRGFILASNRIDCNDYDECANREHDCTQGCRNTQGSYECTCNPGYQLSSNRISCTDINECLTGSHQCSHMCQNTLGSFTCSCPSGFVLSSNGRTCQDINECNSNHGCSHTCVNTAGSYRCTCRTGYRLTANQRLCEDINECASSNSLCSHNCLNTLGSYICTCPSGFTLSPNNQRQCIDINECTNNPGCSHTCANTPGSFRCTCPSGYRLGSNQRTCEDINECRDNTNGCSHGCQNTIGSFLCTCPNGFRLLANQRTCADINECSTNNHGCSHVCTNTDGSYTCTCPSGYNLLPNQRTCEDINECTSSNNCAHECTNTVGSYKCSCQNGYRLNSDGQTCSDIDECSFNNGGCSSVCINTNGSYTCACNPSNLTLTFDGHTCVNANYQCGGQISVGTGAISLPNFPMQSYPSNINCAWRIQLQNATKAISLAFNSNFDIQDSPSCSSSYVEVRDGDGPNSMLVGRYCGSIAPSAITSSTNTLYIRFHSSPDQTTNVGFSASYSTIQLPQDKFGCHNLPIFAPADLGSKSFSTFYNGEPHNCEYKIANIETFKNMQFRVIYTDLQNCSQGKIEIFSGLGATKTRLTTICSARDAEKTIVHVNDIFMTVVYNIKVTGLRGFRAVVRDICNEGHRPTRDGKGCEDINECLINNQCDHICNNSVGSFSCSCRTGYFLNRDRRTCRDINECLSGNGGCSHTCTNSDGSFACSCPNTMTLGENGTTCEALETTAAPTTTTTTATTTTRVTTDATTTTSSPVTANLTKTVIRQALTSATGTVALPTYPSQHYANNRDYIWVIRLSDVSKVVKLTFQSRFDIQDSPSCSSSYVEVRDGDSPNSMLVGRYCGSIAPSAITSSTNTLYILFHSSPDQTTNVGFSASYSTIQLPQGNFICEGVVFAPAQLGSKNFSSFYNGQPQICKLLIGNIPSLKNMDLRVIYTDMPGNCSQAKVVVYLGIGDGRRKLATICSQEDAENTIVHIDDFLVTLEYHVNITGLRGFRAVVVDKCTTGFRPARSGTSCEDINECYNNNGGCSHICRNTQGSFVCSCPSSLVSNGTGCVERKIEQRIRMSNITTSSGTITLPGYPNLPYLENSDYVWVIRLPDISKAIELTFQGRFDIENSPSCSHSFIEVRDGDGPNSMLVGRYCGSIAPSAINSSTNTLYLRLHTSPNRTTDVGFNATFKSVQLAQDKFVCGGVVFAPSQFGSADFSTIYNGGPRVCDTLIGSVTFKSLDFRVIYTDLPGNCSQAKIEVFDGVGTGALKVATICSVEDARNTTVHLSDFLMSIKYEVNIPGLRGFIASVTDTCNPGMIPPRSGTQCERKQIA